MSKSNYQQGEGYHGDKEDLESKCPGVKERICDESGKLRRFVNIYVNDEDIRFIEGKATRIKDGALGWNEKTDSSSDGGEKSLPRLLTLITSVIYCYGGSPRLMNPNLNSKQIQNQRPKQFVRLIGRIRFANVMDMPEVEFRKFIQEVESSSLFKKLMAESNNGVNRDRIIKYQKFPHTGQSSRLLKIKERVLHDKGSFNIESFLDGKEEVVRMIRNLGINKFRKHFLGEELVYEPERIANECGLSLEEVKNIRDLVDEMFIQSEFYCSTNNGEVGGVYYTKVASLEKIDGEYIIGYFDFNSSLGRYVINYGKIEELKKQGFFTKEELKEIDRLLQNLRLINERKTVIYRILENIIDQQRDYLGSGNSLDLKLFTQRELSRKIGVSPSHICRAIRYKNVETPWGQEKPLKFFFPNKKAILKEYIKEIIGKEGDPGSDRAIKEKLEKGIGIHVSRRSVVDYRKELKIPSSYNRR